MKRAGRAIVAGAVSFCALQVALSESIEAEALPIRDPIYTEKWNLLRGHPEFIGDRADRPRLLAIGSSRTQLLIDAAKLGPEYSAFNFGCSGCGPIAQLLHLRRLLDAGVRAEVVAIEVHPAFLADLAEPFEMRWLPPHRLRVGERDYLESFGVPLTANCQWWESASGYRRALLNEYAPDWLPLACAFRRAPCDARGYAAGLDPAPALRAELVTNSRAEYGPAFHGYRPGGAAALALRRMVGLCRDHGMRPLLFVAPESSEFRSWYGEAGNARFAEFLVAFSHGLGLTIWDGREALPDADFADGHHATPRGAAAFTERLRIVLRGGTP